MCDVVDAVEQDMWKDTKALFDQVAEVAVKHHDKMLFAISDEKQCTKELKKYKMHNDDSDFKAIFFAAPKETDHPEKPTEWWIYPDGDVYKKPGSLSLMSFLEKAMAGSLAPYTMSQKIPKKGANTGIVKKCVRKTWDTLVGKAESDVLVSFTSADCDRCRTVASVLKSALRTLKANDVDGASAVTFDAEMNQVPAPYNVTSIPEVYLSPKGMKGMPVRFDFTSLADTVSVAVEQGDKGYGLAFKGGIVGKVKKGSPAQEAGLQRGDVLSHVDGEAVGGMTDRQVIQVIKDAYPPLSMQVTRPREINQKDVIKFLRKNSNLEIPADGELEFSKPEKKAKKKKKKKKKAQPKKARDSAEL